MPTTAPFEAPVLLSGMRHAMLHGGAKVNVRRLFRVLVNR